MKKTALTAAVMASLALFLAAETYRAQAWELLPGESPPAGEQIVLDLHCHACHLMPNADKHSLIGPGGVRLLPTLDWEADRARPEWVFEFLTEPFHLRPELHAQMPNFTLSDEEAMALTRFLMTLKLKRSVYVPKDMPSPLPPQTPETLTAAKAAFDLYKCFQCHLLEGKVIDPEKGQSGPDFIHTYNRLQVDWNYQWLVDPQVFIPGTKMPNFFYSDGEPLLDDPDKDMHLILVYMYSLGEHKSYADFKAKESQYAGGASAEQGKKLAEDLYCTACHEFDGWPKLDLAALNQKHDNRMDLTHLASRRDSAWIKKFLAEKRPDQSGVITGRRCGFQFNNQELNALTEYLSTLK
jgi:cytochrome c2